MNWHLRVAQLTSWLRKLGACDTCSIGMALAQAEKEQGRVYDWKAVNHPCTAACAARARAGYQTLPPRGPVTLVRSYVDREPGSDDDSPTPPTGATT